MSRELISSDPRIATALENYVPVALNTFGLQHENSTTDPEEKRLFFEIVNQADLYQGVPKAYLGNPRFPYHRKKSPEGTPQGFYVVSPNLKVLDSRWGLMANYGSKFLLKMLNQHMPNPGSASISKSRPTAEVVVPENVTVIATAVQLETIDGSELPEGTNSRSKDLLWITDSEVKMLASGKVAGTLKTRILLFHLLDSTPGIPEAWYAGDVQQAELDATVIKDRKDIRVKLSGKFHFEKSTGPFRYKGKIIGEATIRDSKLVDFAMLADGKATSPQTEDPWPPKGDYRMKVGFVPSANDTDRRVLPVVAMIGVETYHAYLNYDMDDPNQ